MEWRSLKHLMCLDQRCGQHSMRWQILTKQILPTFHALADSVKANSVSVGVDPASAQTSEAKDEEQSRGAQVALT